MKVTLHTIITILLVCLVLQEAHASRQKKLYHSHKKEEHLPLHSAQDGAYLKPQSVFQKLYGDKIKRKNAVHVEPLVGTTELGKDRCAANISVLASGPPGTPKATDDMQHTRYKNNSEKKATSSYNNMSSDPSSIDEEHIVSETIIMAATVCIILTSMYLFSNYQYYAQTSFVCSGCYEYMAYEETACESRKHYYEYWGVYV